MTLIKSSTSAIEKASSGLIQFYRANPVIAAKHLLVRDGQPLTLAPVQELILTEWWSSKFSLLTASRGAGKTFISAVYIALQALLYPGTKIGIFAPAFRQSKLIFKEFERLYEESPLLKECVRKAPAYQNDQCICEFKSIGGGKQHSLVKALPVGSDGGKIRGERFRKILMDEIPHLPESIFRSSIQPMLSTPLNPMQRVRQIAELKEQQGFVDVGQLSSDNGYIGITSGYYQFNYWWQEISKFWENIKNGNPSYCLRFVPYTELPEGFYDHGVVTDARENAPMHMFLTEWMAEWIADSEGAFPMSLLETTRDANVLPRSYRDLDKDKNKEFVFGIDVARQNDSTAIVIIEMGYPSKVVHIVELEETPFPQQAKIILNLVKVFNPIMIYMDEFGGGKSLKDHFADPVALGFSQADKIIATDENINYSGKRILRTCVPTPEFIEDANNNTKTLLEQHMIRLPAAINPIESSRKGSKGQRKDIDLVQEMINQIASVVVTPTANGRLHYDLPKTKSNSMYNVKKKDLYSAFVLACKCVYDLKWLPRGDKVIVEVGIVKEIEGPGMAGLTQKSNSIILPSDRLAGTISTNDSNNSPNKRIIVPGGGVILTRNGRKR